MLSEEAIARHAALSGAVKVKPLVWEGDGHWRVGDCEGWLEEANTPFGWGYTIEFGNSIESPWIVSSTFGESLIGFDSPEDAKAAAQADYTARILAALEPIHDAERAELARQNAALRAQVASLTADNEALQRAAAKKVASAEAAIQALRLHQAWSDSEDAGPDYGDQSRDTHPDGERIWRQWWEGNLSLCARAQDEMRNALAAWEASK